MIKETKSCCLTTSVQRQVASSGRPRRSFARRAVAAVDVAMRSSGSNAAGRPRERLLACVALGAVVGALAASWDKSRAVVSSSNLGWMPEEVRRTGDPTVMLEYRRDVIAAALKEWRATVHTTGYAADFDLDAGPLGAGAPLDDVPSATASTRLASRAVGVVDVGARLDPGGALTLTPEPAMPTDVVVPPDLRELILRARSADRGEVMLALSNDVMLCNNPSTCWWDGGNILESFLDVTWRRLGVRNLVLAVLDDATEAYMKKHWPEVHRFRPDLDIPSTQDGTHPPTAYPRSSTSSSASSSPPARASSSPISILSISPTRSNTYTATRTSRVRRTGSTRVGRTGVCREFRTRPWVGAAVACTCRCSPSTSGACTCGRRRGALD